jgi:hypothetical protein
MERVGDWRSKEENWCVRVEERKEKKNIDSCFNW